MKRIVFTVCAVIALASAAVQASPQRTSSIDPASLTSTMSGVVHLHSAANGFFEFEAPNYAVGEIDGQDGWAVDYTGDWAVADANPFAGTQNLSTVSAGFGASGVYGPDVSGLGTEDFTAATAQIAIHNDGTGSTQYFGPSSTVSGYIATRVRFNVDGTIDTLQIDSNQAAIWASTSGTIADEAYHQISVVADNTGAGTIEICLDGTSIFTGDNIAAVLGTSPQIDNVGLLTGMESGSDGSTFDVDNIYIADSATGGCGVAAGINGVYHSGLVNHAIAANGDGTYVNWVDATFDDAGGPTAGWDFNPYSGGPELYFYNPSGNGNQGVVDTSFLYINLQPGDTIDGSLDFDSSADEDNFWVDGDSYYGFSFPCDGRLTYPVVGGTCYGYAHLTTTAPSGFPASIVEYAFDGDGNAITIPIPYTVTPSVGTGDGTITPDTDQTVNENDTIDFTLTADTGFHIDTVDGTCDGSLAGDVYTTDPVTADCTVIANFAADGGGGNLVCESPNHPIATNTSGTYVKWETGEISDGTSISGANFNPYGSSGKLAFYWPNSSSGNDGVAATAGAKDWLVLQNGDQVGPVSVYSHATGAASNWDPGADGYLGFKFNCTTAGTCYGYAHMTSTGPNGFPATLVEYCWDNAGDAVTIGTAPPTGVSVAKEFTPDTVEVNVDSVATITLSNPTAVDAVLTAPLVDTLPTGLTASAASTTCLATVGKLANINAINASVTLPAGATIPANGSCTIDITVQSATAGSYVNTIGAGDLQTDQGDSTAAASATLTVTDPPPPPDPIAVVVPTAGFNFSVDAGDSGTDLLVIGNDGGSDLTYAITEAEMSRGDRSALAKRFSPRAGWTVDPNSISSRDGRVSTGGIAPRANPRPSTVVIDEGFEDMAALLATGDWITANHSDPLGASTWAQCGGTAIPPAFDGGQDDCALVNFNSTTGAGTISNWLLTPSITFDAGATASFYTRTGTGADYADRLEVRVCTTGACTDFGTGANDVGDFTTLLLTINPDLKSGSDPTGVDGYPDTWTKFDLTGLPTSGTGRLAFRYFITSGGPSGDNSNIIGLDRVVVDNGTGGGGGGDCQNPIDIPWLSTDVTSGTVAPSDSDDVTVTADASALVAGSYEANLCVATNDPLEPMFTLPVSLEVTVPDVIFQDGFEDPDGGGADIVTGTLNVPVPADADGVAFDFVTGSTHPYEGGIADHINLYAFTEGMLAVYWYGDVWSLDVGGVTDSSGTEFAVMQSGEVVGPGQTFSAASIAMTNWLGGTDGYIGVAFENGDTGVLNYGYIHMTTSSPDGYPAQVLEYGYNSAGDPITIP